MHKVIHTNKVTINRTSDGVKSYPSGVGSQRVKFNHVRGAINKNAPHVMLSLLLPSLAAATVMVAESFSQASDVSATDAQAIKNVSFSIQDEKSIGVTLSSNNIVLDVSPTSTGTFVSADMTVDVSTNNTTGYTLAMIADETNLSRSVAVNGKVPFIPTIPANKTFTKDSFESGYWGYKIGANEMNYLPMTTDIITIKSTSEAANSSANTIVFATKLDNSIPYGSYEGVTLSFIATINRTPIIITDTMYMQDFYNLSDNDKNSLLNSMTTEQIYTKTDSRDGRTYNIAKMRDGKVWMLQDLRFAGKTGDAENSILTPSDTNVLADVDMTLNNQDPTETSWCASNTVQCTDEWRFYAPSDNATVYYNWYTATAGTGTLDMIADGENATSSICPSGWRLPKGDATGAVENADFYYLVSNYLDELGSPTWDSTEGRWVGTSQQLAKNSTLNLQSSNVVSGSGLSQPGIYYWLSTVRSAEQRVHTLDFHGGYAWPNGSWMRYMGIAIRCVFDGK